jgi:hypothetical protein
MKSCGPKWHLLLDRAVGQPAGNRSDGMEIGQDHADYKQKTGGNSACECAA